jgi:hypothetical protein
MITTAVYIKMVISMYDTTKLVKTPGEKLVNYSVVFFHRLDVGDVASVSEIHATFKVLATLSTSHDVATQKWN